MWHPPSNSTIMGRIRKKNVTSNTIVGQHYIEWLDTSHSPSTPHTSLPILIQCQGCALDDASITLPRTACSTCLFTGDVNLTMILSLSNDRHTNNTFQLVHQLPDISELSYSHFTFMTSSMLIKRPPQPLHILSPSRSLSHQLIEKFILQGSYQSTLIRLSTHLISFKDLSFYTDGSLTNGGSIRMKMGIGWTTAFADLNNLTFHAAVTNNPSSTKAELIAIITALITSPPHVTVSVYTDSQCCVDHFNRLHSSPASTTHYNFASHPNYLQWAILLEMINTLSLTVTLTKVLGHSANHYNDIADHLANTGRHLHILDTCPSLLNDWSCHLTWNNQLIEQPLRLFFKHMFQAYNFDHWTTNFSNLRLRAITHLVNWPCTWLCLKFQSTNHLSLFERNHFTSFKINCLNRSLPTLEKLKLTKPHIYKDTWYCCKCNTSKETWFHLWFCHRSIDTLKEIRDQTLDKFSDLVILNSRHKRSEIRHDLATSAFWIIPTSQPTAINHFSFADLITGLIPNDLVTIIDYHITSTIYTEAIINEAFHFMFNKLYHDMWIPRCSQLSLVEKSFNLSSHDKRSKYDSVIHGTLTQSRYIRPTSNRWIEWCTNVSQFGYSWTDYINMP